MAVGGSELRLRSRRGPPARQPGPCNPGPATRNLQPGRADTTTGTGPGCGSGVPGLDHAASEGAVAEDDDLGAGAGQGDVHAAAIEDEVVPVAGDEADEHGFLLAALEAFDGVDLDAVDVGGVESVSQGGADGLALGAERRDDAEPVVGELEGAAAAVQGDERRGGGGDGLGFEGVLVAVAGAAGVDPHDGTSRVDPPPQLVGEVGEHVGGEREPSFRVAPAGAQPVGVEEAAGHGLDGVAHAVLLAEHDAREDGAQPLEEGAVESAEACGEGFGFELGCNGGGEGVRRGDHGRELAVVADEHEAVRAQERADGHGFGELAGFVDDDDVEERGSAVGSAVDVDAALEDVEEHVSHAGVGGGGDDGGAAHVAGEALQAWRAPGEGSAEVVFGVAAEGLEGGVQLAASGEGVSDAQDVVHAGVEGAREHGVDGGVGVCGEQHPLSVGDEPAHDLGDDGGLSGTGGALDEQAVRRAQGALDGGLLARVEGNCAGRKVDGAVVGWVIGGLRGRSHGFGVVVGRGCFGSVVRVSVEAFAGIGVNAGGGVDQQLEELSPGSDQGAPEGQVHVAEADAGGFAFEEPAVGGESVGESGAVGHEDEVGAGALADDAVEGGLGVEVAAVGDDAIAFMEVGLRRHGEANGAGGGVCGGEHGAGERVLVGEAFREGVGAQEAADVEGGGAVLAFDEADEVEVPAACGVDEGSGGVAPGEVRGHDVLACSALGAEHGGLEAAVLAEPAAGFVAAAVGLLHPGEGSDGGVAVGEVSVEGDEVISGEHDAAFVAEVTAVEGFFGADLRVQEGAFELTVEGLGGFVPQEGVAAQLLFVFGGLAAPGLEFDDVHAALLEEGEVDAAFESVASGEAACFGGAHAGGAGAGGPRCEEGEVGLHAVAELGEIGVLEGGGEQLEALFGDGAVEGGGEIRLFAGGGAHEVFEDAVGEASFDEVVFAGASVAEGDEAAGRAGGSAHAVDAGDVGHGDGEGGLDDGQGGAVDEEEGAVVAVAYGGAEQADLGAFPEGGEGVVDASVGGGAVLPGEGAEGGGVGRGIGGHGAQANAGSALGVHEGLELAHGGVAQVDAFAVVVASGGAFHAVRGHLPGDAPELLGDVSGAARAFGGVRGEAASHEIAEGFGHRVGEVDLAGELSPDDGEDAVGVEGAVAGEERVEDGADAVEVGAVVAVVGVALDELWGEEARRADTLGDGGVLGEEPGQPEVDDPGLSAGVDQDVRGLEVAVHDASGVGVGEAFGDRDHALQGADHVGPGGVALQGGEGRAVDKLHGEPGRRGPAVVEDGHDVGVVQPAQGADLGIEPTGIGLAVEDLQGDAPEGVAGLAGLLIRFVGPGVRRSGGHELVGAVDGGVAALAENIENAVAAGEGIFGNGHGVLRGGVGDAHTPESAWRANRFTLGCLFCTDGPCPVVKMWALGGTAPPGAVDRRSPRVCSAAPIPSARTGCAMLRRTLLWLLFLCLVPWPMASASAEVQMRRLSRDTGATGGPPGVRIEALAPVYAADDAVRRALREFDRSHPRRAVDVFTPRIDAPADRAEAARALFLVGWGLSEAGRHEDALEVLARCVEEAPLFADYCAWKASESAEALDDAPAAEAWATMVDPGAVFGPRARYLRGRALAAQGRHEEAVEVLTDFLGDHPNAFYRTDLEFDLVTSLLALEERDEAALVLHRIAVANPGTAHETRAQRALRAVERDLSADVTARIAPSSFEGRIQRAEVLYNRHRSEQVIELLTPVHRAEGTRTGAGCRATWLIARSWSKLRRHASAAPFYDEIVGACDEELTLRSLYNGGRAWWNAGERDRAFEVFQRIWTEHPEHSFADDAMLFAARIRRSQDREAEAVQLLRSQIERYPDGDMLNDAVWLLMARHMLAGEYRQAARFAEQVGAHTGEDDLYSRGRIAYFRGRALENLSLQREARSVYADVLRDHPMGYYSLLALGRLRQLDRPFAEWLVAELRQDSSRTEGFIRVHPNHAQDNAFRLGREFLRMELHTFAEREFRRLQSAHPNDTELGWAIALFFHHAGAHHISHNVPGSRVGLNLSYPAESNRERWEVAYPRPWWDEVQQAARERGLDPHLIYAIMREESGFRPEVESWANALGLLQLMLPTANDMARLTGRGSVTRRELLDPSINIELGTMFMRTLSDRYGGHPGLVIAGYNGGTGNVGRWLNERGDLDFDLWVEEIPFGQTRNYVKRVSMTYWVYRWLYDERDPWVHMPERLPRR